MTSHGVEERAVLFGDVVDHVDRLDARERLVGVEDLLPIAIVSIVGLELEDLLDDSQWCPHLSPNHVLGQLHQQLV